MFERFTETAKRAVTASEDVALEFGHAFAWTKRQSNLSNYATVIQL